MHWFPLLQGALSPATLFQDAQVLRVSTVQCAQSTARRSPRQMPRLHGIELVGRGFTCLRQQQGFYEGRLRQEALLGHLALSSLHVISYFTWEVQPAGTKGSLHTAHHSLLAHLEENWFAAVRSLFWSCDCVALSLCFEVAAWRGVFTEAIYQEHNPAKLAEVESSPHKPQDYKEAVGSKIKQA